MKKGLWLAIVLTLVIFVLASASSAGGDLPESARRESRKAEKTTETTTEETTTEPVTEPPQPVEVNIMMIGDMLLHYKVQKAGEDSNGNVNYDHLFADFLDDIAWGDLSVVNQEVIIGGRELGMQNYPHFNCLEEVGDAIVKAGFNVVLHATNHTWDQKEKGLRNCLNFWKENYPDEMVLGVHNTPEEAEQITVWEKDGFKIAMLNYTYSLNGYKLPEGKEYLVDLLVDEDKVRADIRKAHELADCVIVFPHWGTEYQLHKSESRNLRRDHHDGHDEGKGNFLELKIINMNAVSGQGGILCRQDRRGQRYDQTVQHTPRDVDGAVVPGVDQVAEEMFLRKKGESGGELGIGTRRVDDHQVKEEQTEGTKENQDRIRDKTQDEQLDHALGVLAHSLIHITFPFLSLRLRSGSRYWAVSIR